MTTSTPTIPEDTKALIAQVLSSLSAVLDLVSEDLDDLEGKQAERSTDARQEKIDILEDFKGKLETAVDALGDLDD